MQERLRQLEVMYREHGPSLLAYLEHCFGEDLADDVLQETFVQAMRNSDRLDSLESPRAWLFGVARNLACNSVRRRRAAVPLDDSLPARTPTPPDDRIEAMRQAMQQLPPQCREALTLRLQSRMSYEEIAKVLDVPVGTVRSRLHTAVSRLRQIMIPKPAPTVAEEDAP